MNVSSWKRTHIHAAGATLLALLLLASVFFVLRPLGRQRTTLAQLRGELETQQATANDFESRRSTLRRRLVRSQHELDAAPLDLKSADTLNAHMARLTDLLDSCHLAIQQTDIAPPQHEQWYSVVPMTLSGTGTYRTCAEFMSRLRKTMPDTAVTSFFMSSNPRSNVNEAGFEFDLVWYAAPSLTAAAE